MKTSKFLVLMLAFVITGCGKDGSSPMTGVNADGTCAQNFLDAHNKLADDAKPLKGDAANDTSVSSGVYDDTIRAVQSDCKALGAAFPKTECKAHAVEISTDMIFRTSDDLAQCTQLQKDLVRIHHLVGPAPTATPTAPVT